MRYDQYMLTGGNYADVFIRCRRCGAADTFDDCQLDVVLTWAEEHELVCEGTDRP